MSDSTDTRDRVTGKALCSLVQIDGSDRSESGSEFLFGRGIVDAYCVGVLGQCHLTPFIGNFPASTPVGSLLRPRRPAAIRRLIISVAVNALQSKPRRANPHIKHKGGWAIFPTFANGYAATAVNCKPFIMRVFASINCVLDCRISAHPSLLRKYAVLCLPSADLFRSQAAAAIRRAALKAPGIYDHFCSAITPKSPKHIPACGSLGPVNFYSNKPAVAKPCSVFSNRHGASYAR